MRILKTLAISGLLLSLTALARADFVTSGQISTINGSDLSISQVQFSATAGTTITIDALVWELFSDLNGDGERTGFDSGLMLFSGTDLVAYADDGGLGADGSESSLDSLLSYDVTETGIFTVTIGQQGYTQTDALAGYEINRLFVDYTGEGKSYGDWQLTITGGSPVSEVPVPAALPLFASALLALGLARRRG